MMPLARILAATAIVTGATPALGASHHEWQGFSETVPAGSAVERELGCGDGSLVSGGYLLDNVGRDKGPFLEAFGADIFFDDSHSNVESARQHVATGHVPRKA